MPVLITSPNTTNAKRKDFWTRKRCRSSVSPIQRICTYNVHTCSVTGMQFSSRCSTSAVNSLPLCCQIGMQNSAASSSIVCLMCLGSAIIVGFVGAWHRQVTLVTVSGVLYIVAGNSQACTITANE